MRNTELTPPEQRVLGCLLEKRFTTPDQYPLSLNALRLACNQATNRNPVTEYDESTVREAAQHLCRRGLARLVSGHTSRTVKYRHLAEEALELDRPQLALLTVLLLRGPQTPGELKGRSERMTPFTSLDDVEGVVATLAERDFVRRVARRPGQKEDRFEHLLGEETDAQPGPSVGSPLGAQPAAASTAPDDRPSQAAPGFDHAAAREPSYESAARLGASQVASPSSPAVWGTQPRGGGAGPGSPDIEALAERIRVLEGHVAALQERIAEQRGEDL